MASAVFLDRDGVLNRAFVRDGKPFPPACLSELEILPGVPEALAALKAEGYLLVVVTNQPDVARGTSQQEEVEAMHARLLSQLPLDRIETCFHDDADCCGCRKPLPGLLLAAAETLRIELSSSFMVGDRWRDIEAGRRAGCGTIFIDYGYAERQPACPDHRVTGLFDSVALILGSRQK